MSDTNTQIDDLVHVAEEVAPVVESGIVAVRDVVDHDYAGAAAAGVQAVNAAVAAAPDVIKGVKEATEVVHELAAHPDAHAISQAVAHLIAAGILSFVEHHVGPMNGDAKSRVTSLLQGIVHAAASFGL